MFEVILFISLSLAIVLYMLDHVGEQERQKQLKYYILDKGFEIKAKSGKLIFADHEELNIDFSLTHFYEGVGDHEDQYYRLIFSIASRVDLDFEIVGRSNARKLLGKSSGDIMEYDRYIIQTNHNDDVQLVLAEPGVYSSLTNGLQRHLRLYAKRRDEQFILTIETELDENLVIEGINFALILVEHLIRLTEG